ncbi:sulfite exporter TauE/SafE family protein [Sporolactobacillus shoreae]|uniref:Probable membrane transporter protein n=1 Tax=Sporolactobacillus shoreae TaxID=1465501 RepID=A0A4Z0GLC2_9BACL|nr:sulfite exporter TauE/SafE family protein [Sporolactobacillus shoreae]TGA96937.1 sulfite exporter TauE/SafE family protein [Sporolactobacillus shoreae]
MSLLVIKLIIVAVLAGIFGSVLGLGGGTVVTPILTLMFGIDINHAIGASLIAVIATSSGAAIAYINDGITNLRIGMFLEVATTIGAITGAFLAGFISSSVLYIIFGLFLLYSALAMLQKKKAEKYDLNREKALANKMKLNGSYYDKNLEKEVPYHAVHVPAGFGVMYGAGVASGLLGIGSGSFKVMAMDLFMKLPLKVSSATSNFMMGVTAAASAGVYLLRGDIDPQISGPIAIGVLVGATIGAKIMQRMKSKTIRIIFVPVIAYIAIQMMLEGLGWKW